MIWPPHLDGGVICGFLVCQRLGLHLLISRSGGSILHREVCKNVLTLYNIFSLSDK